MIKTGRSAAPPIPKAQPGRAIDRFFLYGEPAREAEIRFMHVERITARSRANAWTIRPHSHADLHQILFIEAGGGLLRAEADHHTFQAPALIFVPAGMAHGFQFKPDTDGFVVTMADALVTEVARGDAAILEMARACLCHEGQPGTFADHDIPAALLALEREFVWSAPGRMPAAEAHLTRILVAATRLALSKPVGDAAGGPRDAMLVGRFRQIVERDFRAGLPLAHYADALGVTESRLSSACRRVLGEPASKLVQRRLMVEAQRHLLYTRHSVADIGFALGFTDPAYFSRFFAKRAGLSPGAFRAARSASPEG